MSSKKDLILTNLFKMAIIIRREKSEEAATDVFFLWKDKRFT